MATLYQTVSSCLQKKSDVSSDQMENVNLDPTLDQVKEDEAPELQADKKTDEVRVAENKGGLLWRMSSGLYSTTTGALTGAVGLGVGSVKWVAGKGYDAGSAVVTTTKSVASKVPVSIPKWKSKPKSE